jgi:phosphohistidine phosphatase
MEHLSGKERLMDLILWRHAQAEDLSMALGGIGVSMRDLDRSLTDKGWRQAKKAARWLDKRLEPSSRIFASPSIRTLQTARCLGRELEIVDILYQSSARQIRDWLQWPNLPSTTVVVGHQPAMGRLVSLILTGEEFPLAVETGAFYWLRWKEGREGGQQPVLLWAMSPGCLKKNNEGKKGWS